MEGMGELVCFTFASISIILVPMQDIFILPLQTHSPSSCVVQEAGWYGLHQWDPLPSGFLLSLGQVWEEARRKGGEWGWVTNYLAPFLLGFLELLAFLNKDHNFFNPLHPTPSLFDSSNSSVPLSFWVLGCLRCLAPTRPGALHYPLWSPCMSAHIFWHTPFIKLNSFYQASGKEFYPYSIWYGTLVETDIEMLPF